MPKPAGMQAAHYAAIAAFRYELRQFLAFSEATAAKAGLPAQQHQALLAIAGHAGPVPPSVGDLARQMLIAPHSAAELVARMEAAGLVEKRPSKTDRRRLELLPTRRAVRLLAKLTASHLRELRVLEPALVRALAKVGQG